MLWETFDETISAHIPDAYPEDPKIMVIDENWLVVNAAFGYNLRISLQATFSYCWMVT